ncbi:MAG TPA: PepSY-associated TM helix domain-containing protein [Vicinamibacterales bacterium]
MKPFRAVLFWMHLACGIAAGIVVLVMCVTGVALTYEKQMLEWADRRAWTAPPSADARALSPETLLARVQTAQPGAAPTGITLRADRSAPATVTLDGNKTLLVDPYRGQIIGAPPTGLRTFFRTMTSWHRYLAMEGASRATGRAATGASNLAFLFIVISGTYLWLPKIWTWIQFKNVLWFRGGLSPKARDFNWHNVIGIWTAVPLAIVVAGAVPISYPWASNLVYRIVGDTPPAPAGAQQAGGPGGPAGGQQRGPAGQAGAERGDRTPPTYAAAGVDAAWVNAQSQIPEWRTMTTRLASSDRAPVVIAIDEGYGGQPQKRTTITFDRASAAPQKTELFESLSAGRRLRSWLRFAHTGEIYGLTGQTVAGLVSAGGAVLVYTGIALALRRFAAWIKRRRGAALPERKAA